MSKNRIVKAFWVDIKDHGLPLGATVASWADQWVVALDGYQTDPDDWDRIESELREIVQDAIGSPRGAWDIDAFLAEKGEIIDRALAELREVAKR